MRNRRTFGKQLREKRIDKGYSLCEFAELVGISKAYLSFIERDIVYPPTAKLVNGLSASGRDALR